MHVAILHFHLRAGGVTRVIELAVEALVSLGLDPLVIVGEPAPGGCRIDSSRIAVVPGLAYDCQPDSEISYSVDEACNAYWGKLADVIHLHNHCLGKNFALPATVAGWATAGRSLVLQVHDFAENGRPQNYRRLRQYGLLNLLYPQGPNITYALLNSRDLSRLQASGLESSAVLLPNPVSLPEGTTPVSPSEVGANSMIVYPTRAIRRKNVGEAILWASLCEPGETIVLTGAPASDPIYDQWRQFAIDRRLPIVFDAQTLLNRAAVDFLHGASFCLTTSVDEGFGMAFLEPWLARRSLLGRDLPHLTDDFRAQGVTLDSLYTRLDLPLSWFDPSAIESMVRATVSSICEAYVIPTANRIEEAMSSLIQNNAVDFGRLDEPLQQLALAKIPTSGMKLLRKTPSPLHNAATISQNFSLPAYARRLSSLYKQTLNSLPAAASFLPPDKILTNFLSFKGFYAIRS